MKNEMAIHPGLYLKEAFMLPLNVSNESLSKAIGVTPSTVSRLVNGKSNVSVDMALRLSKAFGNSAQQWLNIQLKWDLKNSNFDLSHITKIK